MEHFCNSTVANCIVVNVSAAVRPFLRLTPPADIDHQVETRLVVPCLAVGTPRPAISWYRNAVLINNTARFVDVHVGLFEHEIFQASLVWSVIALALRLQESKFISLSFS